MQVEIVRKGIKIAGPMPYDDSEVKGIIRTMGGDPALVPKYTAVAFNVGDISVLPVDVVKPNQSRTTTYVLGDRVVTSDKVTYSYNAIRESLINVQIGLLKEVSALQDVKLLEPITYSGVTISATITDLAYTKDVVDQFSEGLILRLDWRAKIDIENISDDTVFDNVALPLENIDDAKALVAAIRKNISDNFTVRELVESEITSETEIDVFDAYNLDVKWDEFKDNL